MPRFPSNLRDNKISFSAYKAPDQVQNLTNFISANKTPNPAGVTIELPVPEKFEDSATHTWTQNTSADFKLKQSALDYVRGGGTDPSMFSKVLGSVKNAVLNSGGLYFDPNFFYVYQHSEPRQFTYAINMVPENSEDAKQMIEIIKLFKKYASPISGPLFIENHMWSIEPSNRELNKAMRLDTKFWAIVNISSDFTGAGIGLFYADGMPKQVNLSITFQEMKTMYIQDWS
jgi:hypothetical protein